MTTIHLGEALRAQIRRHAEGSPEREACGLLVGRREGGRPRRVTEVTLGRNVERMRPRDRFVLDPLHLLEVERASRASGDEILGVWHSHLDRPAVPSEADRAGAFEGWSYLIVSLTEGRAVSLRCWRLQGATFAEESLLGLLSSGLGEKKPVAAPGV